MSPKIKSLLYFICFMVSTAIYYVYEPEDLQNQKESAELVEADIENYTLQAEIFEDTQK
ncbi:hypothetical protein [Ulvibacterium sp.]|uniref:hypothetical protein n=1 Tax=Ulvibacterium sp. TaxID=2665914 RepID=UPI002611A9FC|nr:hypothetical protein [Ulvibacterium sp.]